MIQNKNIGGGARGEEKKPGPPGGLPLWIAHADEEAGRSCSGPFLEPLVPGFPVWIDSCAHTESVIRGSSPGSPGGKPAGPAPQHAAAAPRRCVQICRGKFGFKAEKYMGKLAVSARHLHGPRGAAGGAGENVQELN